VPTEPLVVTPSLIIPGDEIEISFARSGGPGGQNVNKVSSKAEVRWNLRASRAISEHDRAWLLGKIGNKLTNDGELIIVSTKTRDQIQNRGDALDKLAAMLRDGLHRPKTRRATKPSRGSKERRLTSKKVRSGVKKNRNWSGE
jgi:ribosome-associated protein